MYHYIVVKEFKDCYSPPVTTEEVTCQSFEEAIDALPEDTEDMDGKTIWYVKVKRKN